MLEVADILRRYGGAYLDRFGEAVPHRHRRAIRDLVNCRTEALGGHILPLVLDAHYAQHLRAFLDGVALGDLVAESLSARKKP